LIYSVLQPTPENRWGVWANAWGGWVSVSNDGSAKSYDLTTGGFIIGLDHRITDHFAVGLMGSYAYSAANLHLGEDVARVENRMIHEMQKGRLYCWYTHVSD
jgi:outer membrane autotransporter protein